MKKVITAVLLAASFSSYGQIQKEKKVMLSDSSIVSYLTVRDKISGLYLIKKGNVELARGNYVDGKRVGNWYFFNFDKSLFLRYNYDNKKMLFVDNKTLAMASIDVKTDDASIKQAASIPIPIFSLEQYLVLAAHAAKVAVPADHRNRLDNKEVSFVANVSKNSSAQYMLRYEIKGKPFEIKLNLGEQALIEWVPASFGGKDYDSEFIIKTKLSFTKDAGMHRRIDWFN
jgi:hypothetical protein